MKILTRIFVGYLVVAVPLVVAGALALRGAGRSVAAVEQLQRSEQHTRIIDALDAEVLGLERDLQVFTATGHAGVEAGVQKHIREVGALLDELVDDGVDDDASQRRVERMRSSLQVFVATFDEASSARRDRQRLLGEDLRLAQDQLAEALASFAPRTAADRAFAERARAAERDIETLIYRYLSDLDARGLQLARAHVDEVMALRATVTQRAAADRIASRLQSLERGYQAVVQATRGYLYLVGVVMAAETMEFAHEAAALRKTATADALSLAASAVVEAGDLRDQTLATFVFALLIALGLATLTARSIARPLTAISDTLEVLGRGSTVSRIPATDRSDEIGVMARAANVFRARNAETEALLGRSQQLASEVARQRVELERSNSELEAFVYTVSHDLKAPIVTSRGYIGMIQDMAENGQVQDALSRLAVLDNANRRMSALVNNLLELSRVGRADSALRLVDLQALAEEVVRSHQSAFHARDALVHFVSPLPTVLGIEERLRQVLDNLLTNAIKYTASSERPVIEFGCLATEPEIVFFVRDNGSGIPTRYHDKVFRLFQRLDPSQEGSGIGLSIVQRVMSLHGGRVWVESTGEPGEGATFWLALPSADCTPGNELSPTLSIDTPQEGAA